MVCSGVKYKWLCSLEHSRFYNHSATKVTTNTVPLVRVSGRGCRKAERDTHRVQCCPAIFLAFWLLEVACYIPKGCT